MNVFDASAERSGATPSTTGRASRLGGGGGDSSARRPWPSAAAPPPSAFAVYCDDKENCDPATGLLARHAP